LVDVQSVDWQDRAHFLAVAAQMMRRILVDAARKRNATKRGGAALNLNLDDVPDLAVGDDVAIIALGDALDELAKFDSRKARIVELRYFGGLSVEETGQVLKISGETVTRDWRLARAWLMAHMGAPGQSIIGSA
jgi:RNA polymerase sigma-70 factor, ECF subfamily